MAVPGAEHIRVADNSDVFRARRAVKNMAAGAGFDAAGIAELETVAAELATNLVKYADHGGEIAFLLLTEEGATGIEVRAVDSGPGIADMQEALADGHSTRGTLGIGLSGVKRLMDDFTIHSGAGAGTEIIARKWLARQDHAIMKFSVLARPFPGEPVSGDGYFIKHFRDYEIFGVIDALGHGAGAHEVTCKCLEILEAHCHEELGAVVEACHRGLRHSRGAAMALARVDRAGTKFEHVSVGNVETRVYNTSQPVRPYCFNGTLGMMIESGTRPVVYPLVRGALIVMCSDGILSRFNVEPHLFGETVQRIAESIFSEYMRGTDDATVLVGKVI